MKTIDPKISRRRFIATAAAAVAAPSIIPASALGAAGRPAPSERITMGVVGWGMQGPSNTGNFMREPDCQVVATCNIDKNHLAASVNAINGHYKEPGLQNVSRLPRNDGADGHRHRDDR